MKEVRVDKREMKEIGQKELKKGDGGRGKGESRREERRRERREVKRGKERGKGKERVWGTLIPDFCHYIYSTASMCTQTGIHNHIPFQDSKEGGGARHLGRFS